MFSVLHPLTDLCLCSSSHFPQYMIMQLELTLPQPSRPTLSPSLRVHKSAEKLTAETEPSSGDHRWTTIVQTCVRNE